MSKREPTMNEYVASARQFAEQVGDETFLELDAYRASAVGFTLDQMARHYGRRISEKGELLAEVLGRFFRAKGLGASTVRDLQAIGVQSFKRRIDHLLMRGPDGGRA